MEIADRWQHFIRQRVQDIGTNPEAFDLVTREFAELIENEIESSADFALAFPVNPPTELVRFRAEGEMEQVQEAPLKLTPEGPPKRHICHA